MSNEAKALPDNARLLEAVEGLSDDLAQMLGIRYDDPLAVAAAVVTSGYFADRLAQAWAEGHTAQTNHVGWDENPYGTVESACRPSTSPATRHSRALLDGQIGEV